MKDDDVLIARRTARRIELVKLRRPAYSGSGFATLQVAAPPRGTWFPAQSIVVSFRLRKWLARPTQLPFCCKLLSIGNWGRMKYAPKMMPQAFGGLHSNCLCDMIHWLVCGLE